MVGGSQKVTNPNYKIRIRTGLLLERARDELSLVIAYNVLGSSDTKPGNDSVVSKEAYDALTAKMTAQENMNEKLLSDYKDMQADRERDKETIERLTAQLDKLRAERDAGKGKKKKH